MSRKPWAGHTLPCLQVFRNPRGSPAAAWPHFGKTLAPLDSPAVGDGNPEAKGSSQGYPQFVQNYGENEGFVDGETSQFIWGFLPVCANGCLRRGQLDQESRSMRPMRAA